MGLLRSLPLALPALLVGGSLALAPAAAHANPAPDASAPPAAPSPMTPAQPPAALIPQPQGPALQSNGSVTVRELDPRTGAAIEVEEHSLTYLNLGPIFSFVDANDLTYAIGLEASAIHYQHPRIPSFGYGLFAQAQLQNSKYFRTAAGLEASIGPLGAELGLGVRQGDSSYTSTISMHGAVFLSTGYLFVAFRFSPQIAAIPSSQPGFGFETALTVGIKVPIVIQGRDPTGYAVQAAGHAW